MSNSPYQSDAVRTRITVDCTMLGIVPDLVVDDVMDAVTGAQYVQVKRGVIAGGHQSFFRFSL